MKHREKNLTQFFTEYLTLRSERNNELTATDITLACYGALNEVDASLSLPEAFTNMRTDFEYILKVIDNLARSTIKNMDNENKNQSKPTIGNEYYTIPEVATHYSISQQAIRKACKEKRLPYKESSGKNKYLISKADMELYISHAKGKKSFNNGVLDT